MANLRTRLPMNGLQTLAVIFLADAVLALVSAGLAELLMSQPH